MMERGRFDELVESIERRFEGRPDLRWLVIPGDGCCWDTLW